MGIGLRIANLGNSDWAQEYQGEWEKRRYEHQRVQRSLAFCSITKISDPPQLLAACKAFANG